MLGLIWVWHAGPGYTGTSWIYGKTGGAIWATGSNGTVSFVGPLGHVLRVPCLGRFMYPLAVAGLGLIYLRINVSVIFGHPLMKPLQTALSRVKILGLHSNWWANVTGLALVCTESVNVAKVKLGWALETSCNGCGARPVQGPGHGRILGPGAVHTLVGSRSIHKLVAWFLYPLKITSPLNIMLHFWLSKTTVQLILHCGQILMRDATFSKGTMCPVKTVGSPGIIMLQICVDIICLPSGKLIVRGFFVTHLLTMSRPSMMKMDVAPVLAIAWFVAMVNAFKYCDPGALNIYLAVTAIKGEEWQKQIVMDMWVLADTLVVTIVTSSSSLLTDDLTSVGSKN
jgi:hypothetical protein